MSKELSIVSNMKSAIEKRKAEIWQNKASYLAVEQGEYFQRAMVALFENNTLNEIMNSPGGQASIISCMYTACRLGLQFGGYRPQLYVVPIKGKAVLIPTADGLRAIVCGGDNPVLKDVSSNIVYKGENCRISYSEGVVDHYQDIGATDGKRGPMIGAYVKITELSGEKKIVYMPVAEILKRRPGHKSDAWDHYPEEMCLKTIIKKAVKPYLVLKEMADAMDYGEQDTEPVSTEPLPVNERVLNNLERNKAYEKEMNGVQEEPVPATIKKPPEVNPADPF